MITASSPIDRKNANLLSAASQSGESENTKQVVVFWSWCVMKASNYYGLLINFMIIIFLFFRAIIFGFLFGGLCLSVGLVSAGGFGPELGAATNVSQGYSVEKVINSKKIFLGSVRDGAEWNRSEKKIGEYDFNNRRINYPNKLQVANIDVSMVLNWGNVLYDEGDTPHSLGAIAAFGKYAGKLVEQFPRLVSLEIGNEFNGVNFVKGPLASLSPSDRARAYVRLLKAAAESARAVNPNIRISGGATHSVAAGYLWEVLDEGGAQFLDSLAVHPYTTPPEQFVRQVSVLRRHPAATSIPIEVTEFGSSNLAGAADYFMRYYCQMALSGVSHAIWYPLNGRGDGMIPLIEADGSATSVGAAYKFVSEKMQGQPVKDASIDDYSYGCMFGNDVLVFWGESHEASILSSEGVGVYNSMGEPVSDVLKVDAQSPLLFVSENGKDVRKQLKLNATGLIADSYHQFGYPEGEEYQAGIDSFERFARRDGVVIPLVTLPGQEKPNTIWNPYRGNEKYGNIRLTANSLLPGRYKGKPVDIVHRYISDAARDVRVKAKFSVGKNSVDGIKVSVLLDDKVLYAFSGVEPVNIEFEKYLRSGSQIEFVVSSDSNARGDWTLYRISIKEIEK